MNLTVGALGRSHQRYYGRNTCSTFQYSGELDLSFSVIKKTPNERRVILFRQISHTDVRFEARQGLEWARVQRTFPPLSRNGIIPAGSEGLPTPKACTRRCPSSNVGISLNTWSLSIYGYVCLLSSPTGTVVVISHHTKDFTQFHRRKQQNKVLVELPSHPKAFMNNILLLLVWTSKYCSQLKVMPASFWSIKGCCHFTSSQSINSECYKNTFSICFQIKYSMLNALMEHFPFKTHYTKSKYLLGAH